MLKPYKRIFSETMKGIALNDIKEALSKFIYQYNKDGSYSSGYCMYLALGLGEVLHDFLDPKKIQYWELGSKEEPQVHVLVAYNNTPLDASLSWNFNDIIALGDFYADTPLKWMKINKNSIIGGPKNVRDSKEYKKIKEYLGV
jgi:hypothetical protein